MRQKTGPQTSAAEKTIKDIRRATRKHHSSEEKIRIVLEGLRGEDSIAAICRREGIAESLYYSWSKEFLEAGKKRLAGDTARSATSDEVKALRRESRDLKEALADLTLENRLCQRRSNIRPGGGAKPGHCGARMRPREGVARAGLSCVRIDFSKGFSWPFGRDFERGGSCRRSSRGC